MKKKILLPLLLAGMCSTPAFAQTYVTGSVGFGSATLDDIVGYNGSVKSGLPLSIAVGSRFGVYRAEGAISIQSHSYDYTTGGLLVNCDFSSFSLMGNGYYDFIIKESAFTPYLTVGLGIAKSTSKSDGVPLTGGYYVPAFSNDTTGLAIQLGGGVGIKASDVLVVDLGLRYVKPAANVSLTNVLVGARYAF